MAILSPVACRGMKLTLIDLDFKSDPIRPSILRAPIGSPHPHAFSALYTLNEYDSNLDSQTRMTSRPWH